MLTNEIEEEQQSVQSEECLTNEENRLKALLDYGINFSSPEEQLDSITKLLSIICSTPISLVTLLDSTKVWYKSKCGLESESSDRSVSFCNHVIKQDEIFEVCDSHKDERFKKHPFVIGKPNISFYAGIPLVTPSGYHIGVLCVIDRKPRKLNFDQRVALITLARYVIMHLELNKCNKELNMSTDKANKLAKAKDEFLSNMSHEIRTPLNAIYGFTELLNKTNLDKNQQEMLNIVKSSVEILMAIINDILDFSKIESGKLKIENHPFNLEDAIRSIKELFSHKAEEKKLKLIFNFDKKLPKMINGDKTRINQILINLIANAIKFTNKGSIELALKLSEETEDKIGINFSVKDTGIGIPNDKLESIFERFEQASSDTTRKYGGTGLGLSISKNLVELQGGKLRIESEYSKGSYFYFCLYFDKLSKEQTLKILKEERLRIKNRRSGNENEKNEFNENLNKILSKNHVEILVCEDTYFNYKLLQKIFEDTVVNLSYAENGKIGLEKMQSKEFDMVLLDLQMPVIDGFEFTRVTRNELKSDVLILAMTANNSEFEKIKCLELGMNDYFTKPFQRKNFLNGIVSIFNAKYGYVLDFQENSVYSSEFNCSFMSLNSKNKSSSNISYSLNNSNLKQNNYNLNNSSINNTIINSSVDYNSSNNYNSYNNSYIDRGVIQAHSYLVNINENKIKVKNNFLNESFDSKNILKRNSNKFSCNKKHSESINSSINKSISVDSINNNNINQVLSNEEKTNNSQFLFIDQNETLDQDNPFNITKNLIDSMEGKDFDKKSSEHSIYYEVKKPKKESEKVYKINEGNIINLHSDSEFNYENNTSKNFQLISNNNNNNKIKSSNNFYYDINMNNKQNANKNILANSLFDFLPEQKEEKSKSKEDKRKSKQSKIKLKQKENSEETLINIISEENIENYNGNKSNNTYLIIDKNISLFISANYICNRRHSVSTNKKSNKSNSRNAEKSYSKSSERSSNNNSSHFNSVSSGNNYKTEEPKEPENSIKKTLSKKSSYKKIKSKFSIGEFEKKYYENNHSINSLLINDSFRKNLYNSSGNNNCTNSYGDGNNSKFFNNNINNNDKINNEGIVTSKFSKNSIKKIKIKNEANKASVELNCTKRFNESQSSSKSFVLKNSKSENNNNNNNSTKISKISNKEKEKTSNSIYNCEIQSSNSQNLLVDFDDDNENFEISNLKINYDYISEISGGDFEFEKELISIFLRDFPLQLNKLESCLENFNIKHIHLLTHSMKTSLAMIGVDSLAEKFSDIDNYVKDFVKSEKDFRQCNPNERDCCFNCKDDDKNKNDESEILKFEHEEYDEVIFKFREWVKSNVFKELYSFIENSLKEKYFDRL